MEKIDIPQTYSEIDEAIKKDDHHEIVTLSEKILRADPKEKEAFQCKINALINLSRSDEVISFIEKNSCQKEFLLEYAYALHLKKKYEESNSILIKHLSSRKEIIFSINELLAQNYYKMGQYKESFKIYREILDTKIKNSEMEDENDLISNFLAAYVLSEEKEENILRGLMKYLNSWECFYNYSIICLKNGRFTESMEILFRMKKEYPKLSGEYNELKNLNLNIIQASFEGFDYSKFTTIHEEYEKYFSRNELPDLYPYFYNNYLHARKDKDTVNETLRKFDQFLKNDNLQIEERSTLFTNKIILLLRANRINDAYDLFKLTTPNFSNPLNLIIYSYIHYKQDKLEKLEDLVKNDNNIKNLPEGHLIVIQIMLSTLTTKTIEQFHLKVLNFVNQFFDFTVNYNFLNFFIGFYETRHLKDYLKEFVRNYKDVTRIFKILTSHPNEKLLTKKSLLLLGRSFYSAGLYEESVNYFNFVLENLDKFDKEVKLLLINSLAHINTNKSEELRKQIDETMIDLSLDHIDHLLKEVFFKAKRNQGEKKKKVKKKKIIYPKNFDPKKPGPLPDPERWLPKLQRKKFRNIAKNRLAYQGASADNNTTSNQFDRNKK